MRIKNVIPSFIDYPGEICMMVFTAGCNLRCPWCHNKDLIYVEELFMPINDVLSYLKKRRKNAAAICISGGEPTIQESLIDFLQQVKDLGYLVKLDTNGTRPEVVKDALPYLDYIAMDIKAPFYRYNDMAGVAVSIGDIIGSMQVIKGSGIPHEFRTTVAPGLTENNLKLIARSAEPSKYFLQQYTPREKAPFTAEELKRIAEEIGAGVRGL